jgi:hypothetical protein
MATGSTGDRMVNPHSSQVVKVVIIDLLEEVLDVAVDVALVEEVLLAVVEVEVDVALVEEVLLAVVEVEVDVALAQEVLLTVVEVEVDVGQVLRDSESAAAKI